MARRAMSEGHMEEISQPVTFGALLKHFRVERGFSQEELAEYAGVSTRGISDLERGVRRLPHKHTVMALITALHLLDDERMQFLAAARGLLPVPLSPPVSAVNGASLPAFLTPIIGREQVEAEVVGLIRQNVVRLITLIGPAGIGKTRLSVQIAASLRAEYEGGVFFVPLAATQTDEEVFTSIAQVLGVRQVGDQSSRQRLIEVLRSKQVLVVLDNFEQLVTVAPQLVTILQACSRITLLVTSRAILHIRGEHVIAVPPLTVPDPAAVVSSQTVGQYSGVTLFVQRAHALQADFHVTDSTIACIAAICRHLDGLPLAIELAAAWMRVLTPTDLLARLTSASALSLLASGSGDLPERHQSMTAALQWSYALLKKSEQQLLRSLSVFTGTCTLAAIESLASGTQADEVIFDLAALVDKSLVQRQQLVNNDVGFYVLETIRAYGMEQLLAAGETQQLRRHAAYYRTLVVTIAPLLHGPAQQEGMTRLANEYTNIRAALQWLAANHEWEEGLQLAGACWRFWYVRGYLQEGRRWLAQFLTDGHITSLTARAQALFGAGMLATEQGDYQQAAVLTDESIASYHTLHDWRGVAASLNVRGTIAKYQGDFTRAANCFAESLQRYQQSDDRVGIAVALNNLATVAMEQGDYAQANHFQEQSLEIKRAIGDKRGQAVTLVNMGDTARDQGLFARAATLAQAAHALFTELHDTRGQALALNNLGEASHSQGEYAQSRSLLMESLHLFRQLGDTWGCAITLKNLGDSASIVAESKQAITYYLEALNLYDAEANHLGIAESLEAIGGIAWQQGYAVAAVTILSAAAHLRRTIGTSVPPADSAAITQACAALQAVLAPAAYVAAWQNGETAVLSHSIDTARTFCQQMG